MAYIEKKKATTTCTYSLVHRVAHVRVVLKIYSYTLKLLPRSAREYYHRGSKRACAAVYINKNLFTVLWCVCVCVFHLTFKYTTTTHIQTLLLLLWSVTQMRVWDHWKSYLLAAYTVDIKYYMWSVDAGAFLFRQKNNTNLNLFKFWTRLCLYIVSVCVRNAINILWFF